jgi:hypothetical protein
VRVLLPPIALAACALLSGPLWADSASSLRTLDDCLAKLGKGALPATPPAGIDELRVPCPGVEQAIIDSGLSTQLPERWQQWLDRSSLEDLSQLLRRYQSPLPSVAPGVATLHQVAHKLTLSEPPHGWWQDFRAWLWKWLSPPGSTDTSWLSRWLSSFALPQLLLQSLMYLLIGMVLVGTVWIVWRELRLAGLGARNGPAANRSSPLPAGAARSADASPLSLDAVDRAPPREQPSLLLRLLVQALLQSGRLSNDRPLTHRELAVRSNFDDSGQRERFERISLLAERLLYGSVATATATADGDQSQVSRALSEGRELYARWVTRGAPAA